MPNANPLSKLMGQHAALNAPLAPESQAIRAKMENIRAASDVMSPKPVAVVPTEPAKPSPKDLVSPKARYGDRGQERRIPEAGQWSKPLGSMKKGGKVSKTGVYKLHEGEQVLTPEHKDKLKQALSLAEGALSKEAEKEPEPPKKEVKEMRMRRGVNGGFIVNHLHVHAHLHPDEEHVHPDMDSLHSHLEDHWGDPEDGEDEKMETEAEEKKESPGVEAAEKALGYER